MVFTNRLGGELYRWTCGVVEGRPFVWLVVGHQRCIPVRDRDR